VRGCQWVHRPLWSDDYSRMISDLERVGCVERMCDDCDVNVTVSLRPKPNSSKSLVICDCRDLIRKEGFAAKPFKLPRTGELLGRVSSSGEWFFTKVDLQNAYWSCRLPPGWDSKFRFGFTHKDGSVATFRLVVLPFGWNRSGGWLHC